MAKNFNIVELLLKEGVVTQEAIDKANDEVKHTGLSMEKALEKLGYISEEDIVRIEADSLGIPYMDLSDYLIDVELIKLIPENIAQKYKIVPLFKIGNTMTVGMVNPQDIMALDQVRKLSKIDIIEPVLVSNKGLQKAFSTYYGVTGSVEEIARVIDITKQDVSADGKGLSEVAEEAPVVKLVNLMITEAVKDRASDIHIEPEEDAVRVRYRIDGLLHEESVLPKKLQSAVVSRIKILSKMDIAESRKPQDGRIRLKIENKNLDIRVSTFPTVHGENLVMRILDKSSVIFGLKELGFAQQDLEVFNKLIRRPNGIILVTGPTGSGKTTTLYAALTTISTMEKNIITIEDPVEYELPLIRQTQVNIKAGLTFANGLRSILRQDPDIIMVGEIRDKETAEIAIQSALTGHLVFSTLHTNDAPSALTRLIDMGIEPFLISSSVIGILAQRLVRVICDKCKEQYTPEEAVLRNLGIAENINISHGKGCPKCNGSGFVGRIGIFELITVNDAIRKLINAKKSADEIKTKALEQGMRTLRQDGIDKIKQGLTTAEEVLRVTGEI